MNVPAGANVVRGFVVPGLPHPLLAPERSPAWTALRDSFERVRQEIERTEADLLLLYSTQWISVIGHQMQADPEPEWVHVDQEWHELGSMPYRFRMDAEFARAYEAAARARGLHARTVAYRGFPIDTGSIVALKLLNPANRLAAGIVSCNMYADRAETIVLGKAARDAAEKTGRRVIALAVTLLSSRLFVHDIDPKEDRISSQKDDEWNRKLLEILAEGRLEDVSQLAREFSAQANGDQKMKALWWLAALMGEHNRYEGTVYDYQPVWGTGAALVGLVPATRASGDLEFDEESVETYTGDRGVLKSSGEDRRPVLPRAPTSRPTKEGTESSGEDRRPVLLRGPEAPARDLAPPAARGVGTAQTPTSRPTKEGTESSGEDRRPEPAVEPAVTRPSAPSAKVVSEAAPRPVGAYPHARREGDLLFLSGIGPRTPGTNEIPGGPVRAPDGSPRDYDVEAQTRAVIRNVKTVLEAAGSSLESVVDVTVFLIDMDRDFGAFNRVWAEVLGPIGPTRTTLAVSALPTPIAVEMKVIARVRAEAAETAPA